MPAEIVVAATTSELAEACISGAIDIGFMPADDDRRKVLDFSPPYFVIESTYLIGGSANIKALGDVDRSDVSVVGIAGSTHPCRRPQLEGRKDRPGEVRR